MILFYFWLLFTQPESLLYLPADKMRSSAEQINTTYKHNYPGRQALVIEGGISVDGLKGGKLTYDLRGLPEYGVEEIDSTGDTDKAQCYRQPSYL